ncbi:MAG TPA: MipA/OmpV family protein [Rubrivivax sp.]|nr:MipA/OmpV family protein [Rubrivivax sp.]
MPLILAIPTLKPRGAAWPVGRACALLACPLALAVQAQEPTAARPLDEPPAAAAPAPTPTSVSWEGAIGLSAQYRPEYAGAQHRVLKVTPALFLRYGRFTITNASGFVTRRADDVVRGLGVDLLARDRLSVKLSLRYDRGRAEDTSNSLSGMGDIPATVRARLVANWRLDGPWRAGLSWSLDALGRGGGNLGDISFGWEQRVTPATQLAASLSLALAGDRYMQTYYGVSQEQAARTGRPVYEARAGWRDVTGSVSLRHDLGPEWTLLVGLSASRQLGPAADSPLTTQRNGWSASLAAAWRF